MSHGSGWSRSYFRNATLTYSSMARDSGCECDDRQRQCRFFSLCWASKTIHSEKYDLGMHPVPRTPHEKAFMKEQDPLLNLLAEEWTRLRQKAETESNPVKLVMIVDRLNIILSNVERLLCFDDESKQEPGAGARQDDSLREKSGEGD